jgi:RNA polymerase sigma-70 factor (ECF subfamily)
MDIDNEFADNNIRDLQLVELAKKGDEKAFAELMKRYRKPLYQLILKIVENQEDAEDLTIEVF